MERIDIEELATAANDLLNNYLHSSECGCESCEDIRHWKHRFIQWEQQQDLADRPNWDPGAVGP